jgi:hypothetical protein
MPPGNTRSRPPTKVIEKVTVEACLAIARKVQQDRQLSGDATGSEAAAQVARSIEEELLGVS